MGYLFMKIGKCKVDDLNKEPYLCVTLFQDIQESEAITTWR
jgi:hypothetical protein